MLLWLASCGGGGGSSEPPPPTCVIPADGSGWLLMVADGNPDPAVRNYDIFALKVDGTCQQLVAAGPDFDLYPTWSGATGLVAWGAWRDGNARVVLQPVTGGAQQVLDTGPEQATAPALSPDGAVVVFERTADGASTTDVYAVPTTGGTPFEVAAGLVEVKDQQGNVTATCAANDGGPVFSDTPAGRFVYFVSSRSSTSCTVAVNEVWRQPVSAAGAPVGPPEPVTSGSLIQGRPAVSPDGLYVAYARPSGPARTQVVLHELATGTERTVTDRSDAEPTFSPDGRALAVWTMNYDTSGQGRGDIMLVSVETGEILGRLTDGSNSVGSPAFPQ